MAKPKLMPIGRRRLAERELILLVANAEDRAHRLGLHKAGHALNAAKNTLGWEIAERDGGRHAR